MSNTHRFESLFQAVEFLTETFGISNQEATHFVWDKSFKMGTDRGVWIDVASLTK
jgi:hypothetical protein